MDIHVQNNKPDPYLILSTEFNSKQSKDLKVGPKTPRRNIGENLLDIGLGNDILELATKAKVNK